MTLQNDFILFGSTCTNIDSQAAYAADTNTANGRPAGILPSTVLNKILRQGSYASSALAQLIVSYAAQPAIDNGTLSTFTANLVAAIQAIATSSAPSAPPGAPGGRLTLTTGVPLTNSDVIGSTVVYYTPTVNASLPLYNGSAWVNQQLTGDLALSLTSAAAANDIVDVFGTFNGSTPVLGFGPVWATNTPGSCARGVGAGTTQISRVNNGIWANSNIITLTNGGSSYANIPIGQATYLGSIAIDSTAGQTSCYVSAGQNRKWGTWNAYNRKNVNLQVQDGTANWTYAGGMRASNNNSANSLYTFAGLAEEFVPVEFGQYIQNAVNNSTLVIGIGLNSTTSASGKVAQFYNVATIASGGTALVAKFIQPPALGLNRVYALEYTSGLPSPVFYGSNLMLLSASYGA